MTPIAAEAEIAFIKKRRHGQPLPSVDVTSLVHGHAAQINFRQQEVNQALQRSIVPVKENKADVERDLQRTREYRLALQKTCATSQQQLQTCQQQRGQILGRLHSFQETDRDGQSAEETMLSYLGAVSLSCGGKK